MDRTTVCTSDGATNTHGKIPVYTLVSKPRKKRDDSDEKMISGLDDRSQLYSKVDKSKKRAVGGLPGGESAQVNVAVPIPNITTQTRRVKSTVLDSDYELINFSCPPKANSDYDTVFDALPKVDSPYDSVGDDFGYDSVDIVAEDHPKASFPSLAATRLAPEHVYDTVPESQINLTSDYDHISEIPT